MPISCARPVNLEKSPPRLSPPANNKYQSAFGLRETEEALFLFFLLNGKQSSILLRPQTDSDHGNLFKTVRHKKVAVAEGLKRGRRREIAPSGFVTVG